MRQVSAGLVTVVTEQALARADPPQPVAVDEQRHHHPRIWAAAYAELREATPVVGGDCRRRQQQRQQQHEPGHTLPPFDSSTAIGRVPENSESTIVRIAVIGTDRNAPGTPHSSDHTARLMRMANGLRFSELPIR